MFSFNEDEFKKLKDSDKYMKKIKEDVEKLNNDTEFYQWMTDEEDRKMMQNSAKKEGIQEGIEKGIHKKQKEIVRNMKKENIPIEIIKKITGLSIEEINEIS